MKPCKGREGSSCDKNNNCTYPKCKEMKPEKLKGKIIVIGSSETSVAIKAILESKKLDKEIIVVDSKDVSIENFDNDIKKLDLLKRVIIKP